MRIMLDTNVLLYSLTDGERLCRDVRAIMSDYDNSFYVSAESVKELVVLSRHGKIKLSRWNGIGGLLKALQMDYGFTVLPVDMEVMKTYATLEINTDEGHVDPSDHVIISHAMTLRLPLISSDRKFHYYRKQGLDLIENT